jgi:hypothetical protein
MTGIDFPPKMKGRKRKEKEGSKGRKQTLATSGGGGNGGGGGVGEVGKKATKAARGDVQEREVLHLALHATLSQRASVGSEAVRTTINLASCAVRRRALLSGRRCF